MPKYPADAFTHTFHYGPYAPEPEPLEYYRGDASSELWAFRPEYDELDKMKRWEADVLDRARQMKYDAEQAWRAEEDARKAVSIHKSQPTDKEFTSLVRSELQALKGVRTDLMEPFLACIPKFYEQETFRNYWNCPIGYLEEMKTKGPKLLLDGLTRYFAAYASNKPVAQRIADMHAVASDEIYQENWLFKREAKTFSVSAFRDLPFNDPPPVMIDNELAFSGTWIVSPQGRGKTTLLRKLILDRMNEPCSIIILDRKGELAEPFRTRKFPKDVVTIDPHERLALNAFDLGTHSLGTLMQVYSVLLGAAVTPLQSVLLRHAVYLCTHLPQATISTLRDIMVNGVSKYAEAVSAIEDEEERDFWYTDFPTTNYTKTRQELLWRIELLRPPGTILRGMFASPQTKIRMPELMDTNTITIINNSQTALDDFQGEFFARLFLTLILGAAEQRAKQTEKFPCYLFVDEADSAIKNATELAEIIYRCRSQRIATTLAHQSLSQIENKRVQSALADCAIIYANSQNDAHALAPKMNTTVETLTSLQVGEFALSLRGQPTQTVKIPLPDFSHYPLLSKAEIEARDLEMARRYHYTPVKVERELPKPPALDVPTDDDDKPWGGKPVI